MRESTSIQDVAATPAAGDPNRPATIVLIPVTSFATDSNQVLAPCISSIKQSFETLNRQHQIILLVSADDSLTDDEQQALGVSAVIAGTLTDALARFSSHASAQIAIVDPEVRFTDTQWKWLTECGQNTDLAYFYQTHPTHGNRRNRVAQALATVLTRLALRTGKNNCRPGVVSFEVSKLKSLINEGINFESAVELITICREDGYSIFEAQLSSPQFETRQPDSLRDQAKQVSRAAQFWWNNIGFPSVKNDPPSGSSPARSLSVKVRWLGTAILVAIAASVLFSNLDYPFLEPDEARNAQLGLNIYQSGNWMSLTLAQENYWDKPPLQAWMTASSYCLFGPSEFATRLPCAIASLITILTVLLLGSKIFDARTGLLGAAILLLSSGFLICGRYVTMDATLTCCSTIMFLALVLAMRGEKYTKIWLSLAGIACGLGILTKGPVIGVLVLPPVLLVGWLEQNQTLMNVRSWLYLGVPAFLISAPWFIATAIVHPDFLVYFFWKHNVSRFSNAFNHQQPWWFYLPVLILMMYPACFLFPLLVKALISSKRLNKRQLGNQFGKLLLYVLWVVGFFSISQSKLPTYILPALPILCLLLGKTLVLTAKSDSPIFNMGKSLSSIPRHMSVSVGVLLTVIAGALLFFFPSQLNTTTSYLIMGLLSVFSVVFVLRIRSLENVRISMTAVAIVGLLFVSLLVTQLLPKIAKSRSVQAAIVELTETSKFQDSPIVFLGRPPFGNSFCLPDRKILHFSNKHQSDAMIYLMNQPQAIIVASTSHIKDLKRNLIGVKFKKQDLHRKLFTMHSKTATDSRTLEVRQKELPLRVSRLPFSGR